MNIRAYELDAADTDFGITDEEIAAIDAELENEPQPDSVVIGQERAVRAIGFGMGMKAKGYNIYVSGLPGTGKRTAITKILENSGKTARADDRGLRDLVYVNNFRQPDSPVALYFEAGKGSAFKEALGRLADNLKKNLAGLDEAGVRAAIQEEVSALRREFLEPKTGEYHSALE
ncbi:MAG: AAA family ATPase [Spirochaetales bacterium]|jgi:hypothetical protein|nr:AAA family ATPase [Spirochaetales bacterium]